MSQLRRTTTLRSMGCALALLVAACPLLACVPPNGPYAQYPSSPPPNSYDEDGAYRDPNYAGDESSGGGGGRMWYCRAEATTVYGRHIDIMNKGPTRDDAQLRALKDCGSLAGLSDVTSDGNEQRPVESSECEISQCWSAD